jgi:RNase P subunit RPR2
MRKSRFTLIQTTCKRCGKPLMTGSRSLFGFDKEKAELDRICKNCITPEEQSRILKLVPFLN